MKNLVCWPEGSKECWVEKLKACDHSLKPMVPGMMSHRHCLTRTSAVTSRQWSYIRTASAVKMTQRSTEEDNRVEIRKSVGDADGEPNQLL